MTNPWLKKNPFMSMWLSTANAMSGKMWSAGWAEMGRQQAEFMRQTMRFWSGPWLPPARTKQKD